MLLGFQHSERMAQHTAAYAQAFRQACVQAAGVQPRAAGPGKASAINEGTDFQPRSVGSIADLLGNLTNANQFCKTRT